MSRHWNAVIVSTAVFVLLSCDNTLNPPGPPQSVEAVSGDTQVGVAGAELAEPIRVRVADADERAVGGVLVDFVVEEGSGSLKTVGEGGQGSGRLLVETSSTGIAEARWTLGPELGMQGVRALVLGVDSTEFGATSQAGAPAAIVAVGGGGQLAIPGQALPEPLAVRVEDEFGNGVRDVWTLWRVLTGGGGLATDSVLTDSTGQAANTLTLGDSTELNRVEVTVPGGVSGELAALALAEVFEDGDGDTFGSASFPDLDAIGYAWESDSLLLGLRFAESTVGPSGEPLGVSGIVDFDVDRDSLTGVTSAVDDFRPGAGSTGMGVDVFVDMFGSGGDFLLFDFDDNILAQLTPGVHRRLVLVRVPVSELGAGPLEMAAVVGTSVGPTDIVPEDGSLLVAATP